MKDAGWDFRTIHSPRLEVLVDDEVLRGREGVFDLRVLRDQDGRTVATWDDGRWFTPEESAAYVRALAATTRGEQLPFRITLMQEAETGRAVVELDSDGPAHPLTLRLTAGTARTLGRRLLSAAEAAERPSPRNPFRRRAEGRREETSSEPS